MPSHCIYAMDKAKSILGEASYFEEQLGQSIYNRIIPVRNDSIYSYSDIWSASKEDMITFSSRPLGIKIMIDSTWHINLYDYKDNHAMLTIVPPGIPNEDGRVITYTIAIIIKAAQAEESLDNFIDGYISRYPNRTKFEFSDKYPGLLAFDIKNEDMYPDIGGAHMHMIGINRERPEYPGLLLEQPLSLPQMKVIVNWFIIALAIAKQI